MEQYHLKFDDFEKSFLSLKDNNDDNKTPKPSYKEEFNQLFENLKKFKSSKNKTYYLLGKISDHPDLLTYAEKRNKETNGKFFIILKIMRIIYNRLNNFENWVKLYPFNLINKYTSIQENKKAYNLVINTLKNENYLPLYKTLMHSNLMTLIMMMIKKTKRKKKIQ